MYTVTPIGSCRITTPLKLGQASHGLRLNLGRSYGYCHSPAEAVQQARFLRGELDIPAEVWPLVSRSRDRDETAGQEHAQSDLYLVEISSAKELTLDGFSIQLNYLRAGFAEFFADTDRARRYWDLAETGDSAATEEFLAKTWGRNRKQRAEAATLSRIRRRLVTPDSLRADLQTLAALLTEVVFVTHVDAVTPDGQVIASRSALIGMLRAETRALGLPCYDPTELMVEYGQAAALEDDSTSLAHFTPEFSAALMADWMRQHVAPRTARMAATRPEALAAQVAAAIAETRLVEAQARLTALPKDAPQTATLTRDLNDSQAKALAACAAETGTDPVDRLRRAARLGAFETVAAIMDSLPGGTDALPCPILTELALAAVDAGEVAQAATLAIAACRANGTAPRPLRILADLASDHGLALARRVTRDELARIQAQLTDAQIAEALAHPRAPVSTLIAAALPGDRMARIAERTGPKTAARALTRWRTLQGKGRLRDPALVALLDRWTGEAMALPDPLDRARALAVLRTADARHPGLRAALRGARGDLVFRIRALGRAQDLAALLALEPEVRLLPAAGAEFDLWCARLHAAAGNDDHAITSGLAAAEAMPDNINIWVLLMRAATRTGDKPLADRAAAQVVQLSGSETCKLRTEALKVRSNLNVEV
ncbi:hypothetical protein [Maliponia aquimaris]|uniref:Uncharacterized protein n=1 Tax=Maliponia aquimaris TaxID=1673631 RepID=A0A238K0S6_9RHOB|nr:hypothetical protein [Maliponia aquimaris]SMX36490.1 hypothetical protein MAA8898_00886 [Maliponia aquimaris]